MAVNKVDLYVSQILEDLDNGLTWLKRDDIGYGSIQDKYNAKDQQIAMIRKHPALKDAETNITVFNIIDDTKSNDAPVEAKEPQVARPASISHEPVVSVDNNNATVDINEPVEDELAAFANL
jgi:hypothetical protein